MNRCDDTVNGGGRHVGWVVEHAKGARGCAVLHNPHSLVCPFLPPSSRQTPQLPSAATARPEVTRLLPTTRQPLSFQPPSPIQSLLHPSSSIILLLSLPHPPPSPFHPVFPSSSIFLAVLIYRLAYFMCVNYNSFQKMIPVYRDLCH